LGDYTTALSYFSQLAHLYGKASWSHLELNMLNMYAHCLKETKQNEEYVRIGLEIVAKLVLENDAMSNIQNTLERESSSLTELIAASRTIDKQLTVPMQDFFGDIDVDPYTRPYDDHDGFRLQVQVTNLTSEGIKAHEVRIKLVTVEEEHHSELWLTADNVTMIQPGTVAISVGTKVCKILHYSSSLAHGIRL
jgi:hypothetical protein